MLALPFCVLHQQNLFSVLSLFQDIRFQNFIPPSPIQILYKVVPCYACAKGVFLSFSFSIGWCPTNRNISPMVFFTNKIYSPNYRCFKTLRFRNFIPPSPIQILYKIVQRYACAKGVFLSFSSSTFCLDTKSGAKKSRRSEGVCKAPGLLTFRALSSNPHADAASAP